MNAKHGMTVSDVQASERFNDLTTLPASLATHKSTDSALFYQFVDRTFFHV